MRTGNEKRSIRRKNHPPWEREISLKEAAKSVNIEGALNTNLARGTMSINNLKIHSVIWGSPDRITNQSDEK